MIAVDQGLCSGCRTCAKVCPHGVIVMRDRVAEIAHEERCIECGACSLNCHEGAMHVTEGTGCLHIIIKEDILGIRAAEAT